MLIADRICQLLGLSETVIPTEEIFWAFRKFVEALGRDRPLLLVFEDIHWAEPIVPGSHRAYRRVGSATRRSCSFV